MTWKQKEKKQAKNEQLQCKFVTKWASKQREKKYGRDQGDHTLPNERKKKH